MTFSARRRLAYGLMTGFALLLLLGACAEVYLRLRWVSPRALSTQAFWQHPLYGSAPGPGASGRQVTSEYDSSFAHNRFGMRGLPPTLTPKTPDSEPRLMLLGDSHTYGLGCDQGSTFADLMHVAWGAGNLANAGSNGYGTRESLAWLHHFGAAWQPDVVVLTFFWNDLEDNLKPDKPRFELREGRVVRIDEVPGDFDSLAPLPAFEPGKPRTKALHLSEFVKYGLRGLRYRTLGIRKRSIREASDMDAAWETTHGLLDLVKQRTDEIGARLVIACLPDQSQVDAGQAIKNIEPLNYEIQGKLFAWCDRAGVQKVDLQPGLLAAFEADPGTELFYYADRHMTAAGHAVVAEVLLKAIGG